MVEQIAEMVKVLSSIFMSRYVAFFYISLSFPGTTFLPLLAGQHQKAIGAFYHVLILPDILATALDPTSCILSLSLRFM